jgi:hypothetical protein
MRILLKFPTRGRPQQFVSTLRGWLEKSDDLSRIAVLVSYDSDDATMTPEVIAEAEKLHPAIAAIGGHSKSKIDACNRDIPEYKGDWSAVLLISDDMWCSTQGWDSHIRENMERRFPDTDGALWFWDGAQRRINTLECVGRKRYTKLGFLYHPSYFSFFSDNETTAVGLRDGKLAVIEESICRHQHPAWLGGMAVDDTYRRNHAFWDQDKANFAKRKAEGFPL